MDSLVTRVPPPVLALGSAVFMWALDRVGLGGPSFGNGGFIVIGVVLSVAGIAIAILGLREFRRAQTTFDPHRIDETSALVTAGPYRFTRNPMYLGLLSVVVGFGLALGQLTPLLVGPLVFVALITMLQIRPEEQMMATLFGAEYDQYRSRVRRWL